MGLAADWLRLRVFDLETIVGGIRPWGGLARRIVGGFVLLLGPLIAAQVGMPSPVTAADAPAVPVPTCETALVAVPGLDEVLPVNVVLGTSGTPIHVSGAYGIGISPDAQTAWVVGNHATAPYWTVAPIDLATGESGTVIPLDALPQGGPISNPVVTPDGKHLLIGTANFLTTIDLATSTIDPVIAYPPPFHGAQVAVTPDGATVLVGSPFQGVLAINLATRTAGPIVAAGYSPSDVAINPTGTTAYAANNFSNTITPIELPSLHPDPDLPTGLAPGLIAIDPEGKVAVITTNSGIVRQDLATGAPSPATPVAMILWQAVTPDGHTDLVVAQNPNRLVPVSLTTGVAGQPIPLPGMPLGVGAIAADQAPVAAASAAPAPAGQPSRLDGSASTAACGQIADYRWDFGDGSPTQTTSIPTVDHTYQSPGNYSATLTVTDSAGTSTTKVFTGQAMNRNGGPQATTALHLAVPIAEATPAPAVEASPGFTG